MTKKIAVLTDSTAYIPEEIRKALDIHVIPLNVVWGERSYLDNVDITPEVFYEMLQKEPDLPTTSQPSAGAFKQVFEELSKNYAGVVAVLISADLSGTVASALAAKEMMGEFPIEVIDSRLTTMALGMMAVRAAERALSGGDLTIVAAAARELIGKVKVMFVVDTLEFLHKGGRIGGAKRLVGSLLSMKPLLQLEDGKIAALDSVRTKKKAIQTMIGEFIKDAEGKDKVHLTVFHGVAEPEAKAVIEEIEKSYPLASKYLAKLSPTLGVHTGPGTVGIGYYFE
jgi:DegV family protein with EDD domain